MLDDRMQLADAIFGNDGNDGARRVTATATADSSDGKVMVEFAGGETAEVGTIAPVTKGQKVAMLLQDGQATVIGADGWGDTIRASAGETATLVRAYEGGVLVCKTGNPVGVLVNADGSFDVIAVTWDGDTPTAGGFIVAMDTNGLQIYDPAGIGENGVQRSVTMQKGTCYIGSSIANESTNGGSELHVHATGSIKAGIEQSASGTAKRASVELQFIGPDMDTELGDQYDSTLVLGKVDNLCVYTGNGTYGGTVPVDWITETHIAGAGFIPPSSTGSPTGTLADGWNWEKYASGKVHLWGAIRNEQAGATSAFGSIYRTGWDWTVQLPMVVKRMRSVNYSRALPGYSFGAWATPAGPFSTWWNDSGINYIRYRWCSFSSTNSELAATVDIWATV